MKSKIIIMIMCVMFLFSGCSLFHPNTNININDGVLRDESGTSLVTDKGDIPVMIHHYTGESFSYFLTMVINSTTLTENAYVGNETVYVTSTSGCTIFDAINIYDDENYFQGIIQEVGIDHINFTSKLDRNFNISNTVVQCAEWDLSTTDGTIEEKVFSIEAPTNKIWHISSTVINILDDSPMDSATFGGRTALSNGISGRIVDGYIKEMFLIYNNNGFNLRGFELDYIDKAPSGVYGLNAMLKFEESYGAMVRLDGETNYQWQAVNRDDLTSQEQIAITVNGHIREILE